MSFENDIKEIVNTIFNKYLPDYSKDKQLKKLYYNYIHTDLSNEKGKQNPDKKILLNFLKPQLEIDFSDNENKDTQEAHAFVKKYQKINGRRLSLKKKADAIHKKIDDLDIMVFAYYPFYSVIWDGHQKFLENKKLKKRLKEEMKKKVMNYELPKDTPPKLQKLFNDYISDIHPKIFNLDYHPDDLFIGSIDFRIDYPKLYKYLDKHLSVTEDENVKLFKLFNKLDDKIQALISTDYDKLRFITLLPYYSVLVGREEKTRMKPRGKIHVVKKLNIDTFAKAGRKFNSFFNFATNEMLGGIYNDYPQFLVLYSKYLKSFYSPTTLKLSYDKLQNFVILWRYRDLVPGTQYVNVENYKFGKEYTDLVEFLKKFLKDTPKKGRKSLINNVNSITDKLTLFTGQDMTGSRRDHFAFLALQLLVYAPFADAYSPPKLKKD